MRRNTDTEMNFQKEIIAVFEKYDTDLGFSVMGDVMLAWLIHTMRERMKGNLTYWAFFKIMTKTWNDVGRAKDLGVI